MFTNNQIRLAGCFSEVCTLSRIRFQWQFFLAVSILTMSVTVNEKKILPSCISLTVQSRGCVCACSDPVHSGDVIMSVISNHQPHDCLLNRLFRRRSKKTPKLRVAGLCEGNSSATGEFPAQRASNAENISIWWRHHDIEQWDCLHNPQGFQ